jgi:hypothetical protein
MTMPSDYIEDAPQAYQIDKVPVHIESANAVHVRVTTAEFASCMTWPLDFTKPTRLLTRQYRRARAWIVIQSLGGATSVWFNSKSNALLGSAPQGIQVTALPFVLPWDAQEPCYAIAAGSGTLPTVNVLDQVYGER